MIELEAHIPETPARSCALFIGSDAFQKLLVTQHRVAILADSAIATTHGKKVASFLQQQGHEILFIQLPQGEACKTTAVYANVLSQLAAANFSRDTAVVSVGGGATSDLAGFVAATFLRGVAFYSCPTTLLAMVDASVGGKTSINLSEGKNLVGAFYQANSVCMDTSSLHSLPEKVFREGASEMFKHGLLANPSLCSAVLDQNFSTEASNLEELVAEAVKIKIDVVGQDPFESGVRAHLNLGHTLAHALEAHSQHALSHGEAVGYGLLYALELSKFFGFKDNTQYGLNFLRYLKPKKFLAPQWDELLIYMMRDKKTNADGLRFVLLEDLGRAKLMPVPENLQRAAWQEFVAQTKDL